MAARGQAFETMMLVISVIVALAILNVLMGIIQGVNVNVQNSVDQQMHDALKQVAKDGYGFSTPQKGVLKKGVRLNSRSILKNDLPELDPNAVRFCIDRSSTGGFSTNILPATPSSSCTTTINSGATDIGPVEQDTAFSLVVCGDSNVGTRGGYRISLAISPQGASANCKIPTTP